MGWPSGGHLVEPRAKAGSLQQGAQQVGVQAGLESRPRRRLPSFSGQPVPALGRPRCAEVPSHTGVELPVPPIQLLAVSPCPVPADRCQEVGRVPLSPTQKILSSEDIN